MTRETKIGLLVGLAFIIVIGILLSDHLSSSTQPPPARLSDAGPNARNGVITPSAAQNPPVTLVGAAPAPTPVAPVPTAEELRLPPVQFIPDSGPWHAGGQDYDAAVTIGPPPQQPQYQASAAPVNPQPATGLAAIEEVARRYEEPIVPLDNRQARTTTTPTQNTAAPAAGNVSRSATQGMEYRAQPGDTLSRLAGRFMGGNTPANRDAIVRANPSLANNPDLIVAGRLYIIPVPEESAQVASARQAPASAPAPAPAPTEKWYTAREGDSLWRIAAEQLGDGTAWMQLKELNEETLRGGEMVRPGMRLRIQ